MGKKPKKNKKSCKNSDCYDLARSSRLNQHASTGSDDADDGIRQDVAAFNLNNSRGKRLYQTERNKIPMVDVSPEKAATFFHTVEVNLNQTTTIVGWQPNTAKVHPIDSKPKAKPKAKTASSPERVKTTTAPSTPIQSEGPAPPRDTNSTPTPRENPGKGKGKNDSDQAGKIAANKKGQHLGYGWKTLEDCAGIVGSIRPVYGGQRRERKELA